MEMLCEKVVEVRMVCYRVMSVVLEEGLFYDELKGFLDMCSVDDLVMCLGDFNGHVGWNIYGGVIRECGVGYRNLEG